MQDMLDAIERIRDFTDHEDVDAFVSDPRSVFAVAYAVLIIGEAASAIPEEVRLAHPEIPWAPMRGMRNFVAHAYFEVDAAILWETARQDVPALEAQLRTLLGEEE